MAVSFDSDASAIEALFASSFAGAAFGVSPRPLIAHDNQDFNPPDDQAWMRLTILPAADDQRSMGAPSGGVYEAVGLAVVDIHTPRGIGAGDAWRIADVVAGWFRGVTSGGIEFIGPTAEGPQIIRVGHDGRSFQVNVVIHWRSFRAA